MNQQLWENMTKSEHTHTTPNGFCFRFFKNELLGQDAFALEIDFNSKEMKIVEIRNKIPELEEFFKNPENLSIMQAMLSMYARDFEYGCLLAGQPTKKIFSTYNVRGEDLFITEKFAMLPIV